MATPARSSLAPSLLALALAGAACGGDGPPPLGDVGDPCTSASRCRAGLVCFEGLCAIPGGVGDPCASASHCQAGLVCFEGLCATEAPASATCTPAAHAPSIVDGGPISLVQADYDACVSAIRPASPGLVAVALGVSPVGTQLDFDVPAGTASFSIVSQEETDSAVPTVAIQGWAYANAPVPTDVRYPGGALFYDDMSSWFSDASRIGSLPAFAFGFAPQTGAFTHPSTSAGIDRLYAEGGAPAGTWRLTVSDYAYECVPGVSRLATYCDTGAGSSAGRYDVTVLRRPGPIASTGTLDLSVVLVSTSFTRAGALGSAAFQRYVDSLQALFGQAGICLGTVRVYDMPAWAVTRWWSIDVDDTTPCGELSQLFTTAPDANAVHVFLVDDLKSASAPPLSTVVGIDGSIPGPSGVSGTIVSGAAVELASNLAPGPPCSPSFDPASCDPDFLAYVTAHEAGHWLGLFHVTEAYGGLWDPLNDTATCDCPCLTNPLTRGDCDAGRPGGELGAASCLSGATCGGGDNLMFWLYQDGYSVGSMSPEQGRVMRLNPAVH
ncbi:MAG TPA: hypothetical protein VLS93_14785 [Anaeromyxobacteraceae bacterium]|nr:hypothetical protein [Anaeromyxobacteraceae bacterium]